MSAQEQVRQQAVARLMSGRGGILPSVKEQDEAAALVEKGLDPATALLVASTPIVEELTPELKALFDL